jgi:hypothetical protein
MGLSFHGGIRLPSNPVEHGDCSPAILKKVEGEQVLAGRNQPGCEVAAHETKADESNLLAHVIPFPANAAEEALLLSGAFHGRSL